MVVHSCLVIPGYSGNEVTCMWNTIPGAGPAPVEPMIYPAEMSGKIHAEWQVMYLDAATGRSIPVIHPVDYWVVAMDYPPDLRLRVATLPAPGITFLFFSLIHYSSSSLTSLCTHSCLYFTVYSLPSSLVHSCNRSRTPIRISRAWSYGF